MHYSPLHKMHNQWLFVFYCIWINITILNCFVALYCCRYLNLSSLQILEYCWTLNNNNISLKNEPVFSLCFESWKQTTGADIDRADCCDIIGPSQHVVGGVCFGLQTAALECWDQATAWTYAAPYRATEAKQRQLFPDERQTESVNVLISQTL